MAFILSLSLLYEIRKFYAQNEAQELADFNHSVLQLIVSSARHMHVRGKYRAPSLIE